MMVFMGFGWAKPVMVDMRRFRNPKIGMAITAFAGPMSNFLLAILLMPLYGMLVAFGYRGGSYMYYAAQLVASTVYMSISLGLFNLIPIPPLDGSKVVEAVLPQHIYFRIMRYERYGMILLFILVWSDIFNAPLTAAVDFVFEKMLYIAQWAFELAVKFI